MANFTSYSNALVLMTALCNKLRELNEAYVFKGSVAFANLPSTLTEDMCGYTYNVTDDFTTDNRFVEGSGKSYSAGSNVVVANMTTTTYDEVTPVGTENPSEEGWYEFDGSAYVLTQDTEIQTGKTYYEQIVTPTYKFDVIGNFIDVESIMDNINSVAAMITDAIFSSASAYSIGDVVIYENSLYQFKAAHTAGTDWDATEVDEITVEEQLTTKADKSNIVTYSAGSNISIVSVGRLDLFEYTWSNVAPNSTTSWTTIPDSKSLTSSAIGLESVTKFKLQAATKQTHTIFFSGAFVDNSNVLHDFPSSALNQDGTIKQDTEIEVPSGYTGMRLTARLDNQSYQQGSEVHESDFDYIRIEIIEGTHSKEVEDQTNKIINVVPDLDTTYATKATTKTAWEGTAAQYAALTSDDYDLYFVEEST